MLYDFILYSTKIYKVWSSCMIRLISRRLLLEQYGLVRHRIVIADKAVCRGLLKGSLNESGKKWKTLHTGTSCLPLKVPSSKQTMLEQLLQLFNKAQLVTWECPLHTEKSPSSRIKISTSAPAGLMKTCDAASVAVGKIPWKTWQSCWNNGFLFKQL